MQLVTFTFGNNLDNRTISIKGTTMRNAMRNAMHWAAKQLGVKECNLVFIELAEKRAA